MKEGKTLQELALEIERRSQAKQDLIVPAKGLRMYAWDDGGGVGLEFNSKEAEPITWINDVAHDQISGYCDIPKKYYDRCLRESPKLLANNVSHWFSLDSSPRLVRKLDGRARAFLSNRYRPLENEDLAQAILPVIASDEQFDLMSCEITERRLYLKVVHKKVTRELSKTGNYFGDQKHRIVQVLAPAVTISNSEVGCGSLSVQAGWFNSFCSNLATMGERSMKKYHVGAKHELLGEEAFAMLSDETRRKTDEALWMQLTDVLRGAFDEVRFNELVDRIEGTRADVIDKKADVVQVVSFASKEVGINEGEQKGILQYLIEGGDLSRFGVHNAITRYSQDVESYDRATELERAGAALIEMPKTQWAKVVALAS